MNLLFLFISLPLNVICCPSYVVNVPCQFEIEIPLLCIKEVPLPDPFPLGNGLMPLTSAVQLLSLSIVLVGVSSEMILLSVGISTSSNSLRPIEIIVCNFLTYVPYLIIWIAIVTGGSSGIGSVTAVALAKDEGAKVVIAACREKEGEETTQLIKATGSDGPICKDRCDKRR